MRPLCPAGGVYITDGGPAQTQNRGEAPPPAAVQLHAARTSPDRNPLQQKRGTRSRMIGQPVRFFTVNGTKRHSQGHVPRPDDTRTSAQPFWTEFWTERLQALKRHLESAPASTSDTGSGLDAGDDG
jgi:hypothetical protein